MENLISDLIELGFQILNIVVWQKSDLPPTLYGERLNFSAEYIAIAAIFSWLQKIAAILTESLRIKGSGVEVGHHHLDDAPRQG